MREIESRVRAPKPQAPHLQEVISTPVLSQRQAKAPDYQRESEALGSLATTLAEAPYEIPQRLVDLARALTRAGSAGISLQERLNGEPVFRWVATAGTFKDLAGQTLPRHFSPCGVVLDRGTALLMSEPVRSFPYIADLPDPVREVLLVPFTQNGVPNGTVWVAHHDAERQFDQEDLRLVTSLSAFAAAACGTVGWPISTSSISLRSVMQAT